MTMRTFALLALALSWLIAPVPVLAQDGGNPCAAINSCATPQKFDSTASTNSTSVRSVPTGLVNIIVINETTAIYYLKLYDKATAPTCNSDTVVAKYPIPFGASNAGGGFQMTRAVSARFQNGLAFCLTGGRADSDTTNAATGVTINFEYRQ